MTEQELRSRLENLTGEIPAETHRAFLSAASPGKEAKVMKKKISAGLVFALVLALLAVAAIAAGIGYNLEWWYTERNGVVDPAAFQAMMDQQEESLRTKYRQPFLNIRAIMLHLCALKALECQEYTMPDLIVMEGDPALCNADMGILTEMGTRLCVLFHKVDRHIRRICYHGFTYAEWETRNRTPSRALLTDAAQGAAPHIQQTAKVISLDEQRRQREKRNKK